MCRFDVRDLWPRVSLDTALTLRNMPPMEPGDDPVIPCPVCGNQAFLSGDRRIVYCPWTCRCAMPGPASAALIKALRRRRRGRTIRLTI